MSRTHRLHLISIGELNTSRPDKGVHCCSRQSFNGSLSGRLQPQSYRILWWDEGRTRSYSKEPGGSYFITRSGLIEGVRRASLSKLFTITCLVHTSSESETRISCHRRAYFRVLFHSKHSSLVLLLKSAWTSQTASSTAVERTKGCNVCEDSLRCRFWSK